MQNKRKNDEQRDQYKRNKKPITEAMLVMDLPHEYLDRPSESWFTPNRYAIACRNCNKLTHIEPEHWDSKRCPNCKALLPAGHAREGRSR